MSFSKPCMKCILSMRRLQISEPRTALLKRMISAGTMLAVKSDQLIATGSVGGQTTDRIGVTAEALHVARKEEIVTGMMTAASAEIGILIGGATDRKIHLMGPADDMMIEIGGIVEIAEIATAAIPEIETEMTVMKGMSVVGLLRMTNISVTGHPTATKSLEETGMTRAAAIEPTPSEVKIPRKRDKTTDRRSVRIVKTPPWPGKNKMKNQSKKPKSGPRTRTGAAVIA